MEFRIPSALSSGICEPMPRFARQIPLGDITQTPPHEVGMLVRNVRPPERRELFVFSTWLLWGSGSDNKGKTCSKSFITVSERNLKFHAIEWISTRHVAPALWALHTESNDENWKTPRGHRRLILINYGRHQGLALRWLSFFMVSPRETS